MTSIGTNHAISDDPDRQFISCYAKTNRKNIENFHAMRKGEYLILKKDKNKHDRRENV